MCCVKWIRERRIKSQLSTAIKWKETKSIMHLDYIKFECKFKRGLLTMPVTQYKKKTYIITKK